MNDILSELTQLKADYSAAQTLLAEAQSAKEAFDAQLSDKESAITAKDATLSALEAEVAENKAKVASLTESLESLKKAQVSAEKKAVELVAAQGIPAVKVNKAEEVKPATGAEVLAQWGELRTAQDRAEFYRQNKALMNGR